MAGGAHAPTRYQKGVNLHRIRQVLAVTLQRGLSRGVSLYKRSVGLFAHGHARAAGQAAGSGLPAAAAVPLQDFQEGLFAQALDGGRNLFVQGWVDEAQERDTLQVGGLSGPRVSTVCN